MAAHVRSASLHLGFRLHMGFTERSLVVGMGLWNIWRLGPKIPLYGFCLPLHVKLINRICWLFLGVEMDKHIWQNCHSIRSYLWLVFYLPRDMFFSKRKSVFYIFQNRVRNFICGTEEAASSAL